MQAVDQAREGGESQKNAIAFDVSSLNKSPFLVRLHRRAIDALTRSDLSELRRLLYLLEPLEGLAPPARFASDDFAAKDSDEVRSLHRLLGALLKHTERNLRLLRQGARSHSPYRTIY